ncbi:MAG: transglutaminase-like domain-containing protein [Gammaproteobacteria bacterium]
MHDLPLEDEFRAFAAAPADAITGGLLVARVLDPGCAVAWVLGELDRLAAAAPAKRDTHAVLATLDAAGFRGAEDYYATVNSSLEHVLRTRQGIPISLALVVIGVAQRRGLSAIGINFPRHFLVRVDDVLIDPFELRPVDPEWLEATLAEQQLEADRALTPAGPRDIVLRMLNNLRLIAVQRGEHAQALDLTGYQLVLGADALPLHVERAELWLAVGVPDMARHELERAIALAPTAALRARLEDYHRIIVATPSRVH